MDLKKIKSQPHVVTNMRNKKNSEKIMSCLVPSIIYYKIISNEVNPKCGQPIR